jgi:hypothetical protein
MELKGEEVYTGWAYSTGRDFYSETWSVDMPPSTAFVKTYLCDHVLFGENGTVETGILTYDIIFLTIVTAESTSPA